MKPRIKTSSRKGKYGNIRTRKIPRQQGEPSDTKDYSGFIIGFMVVIIIVLILL